MQVGRDVGIPMGDATVFRVGDAIISSGTTGSSTMANGSFCIGASCTLGDVVGSASTLGGGASDSVLVPGACSVVVLKIRMRARSWSMPLVASGGGRVPFRLFANFLLLARWRQPASRLVT